MNRSFTFHDAARRIMAPVLFACVLLSIQCESAYAQSNKRIEAIRSLYQQTNAQIARSERSGDANIFCNELLINSGEKMWPAVGTYRRKIRLYYTFALNREKQPYPNRLLKVTVKAQTAAPQSNTEYLFNSDGQLVFVFTDEPGNPDRALRLYFDKGKLIHALGGKNVQNVRAAAIANSARNVMNQAARLKSIFQQSLQIAHNSTP